METGGIKLTETIYILAFSVYGSIAHTLLSNQTTGKSGGALIVLLFINSVVASFAGLMAYLFAMKINLSGHEVYLMVGMAGFMGGKFLELIELHILKRIEGPRL